MTINWYGQTCFKITSQNGKDGQVNIIIDPPTKESGLRGPKLEADILLSTNTKNKISNNSYFLIDGPGEYDIKDVYIQGFSSNNGAFIYTLETEGIKICHLGKINQSELSSELVGLLGEIDLLFIPIGGGDSLEAKTAVKIMAQIEPKIIIPMNYKIAGLKEKLESIEGFLKLLGIKNLEKMPKLTIKEKDLPKEEVKVIALEP